MKTRRNTGFTVVELLVVIAVLAVLVTIGVMSYAAYQDRAKMTRKQASETQLNQVMSEYAAKNGHYPTNFSTALSSDETIKAVSSGVVSIATCNNKEKVCVSSSYYNAAGSGYQYVYWDNYTDYWYAVQKTRQPASSSSAGRVDTANRNCGTGSSALSWSSCA